jgi:hypothetical protein
LIGSNLLIWLAVFMLDYTILLVYTQALYKEEVMYS